MCRVDVTEVACIPLAELLADIAVALAADLDSDPSDVTIGPVDFGQGIDQ